MSENVRVLDNPVLQDILLRLRDKNTNYPEFRRLMAKAGVFIGYEIAKELDLSVERVETPLGVEAEGVKLRDEDVAVIAVLRAAIPLAMGILETLERAKLGVVSAKRAEEEDAESKGFEMEVDVRYLGLPSSAGDVVLVDPMLATGSTMAKIIRIIKERYPYRRLFVASVISTSIGIQRVLDAEPEAKVYTLAVDPKLNKRAYIVPGLGDAGDRAFG